MKIYVKIWAVLLAILGISLALGAMGNVVLATSLIFALATVKAYLVIVYFMKLGSEPRYIAYAMGIGVLCLAILYLGLVPDIVYVYGQP